MKAILRHEYGSTDVLKLQEVENPTPENNEILVKIMAGALNSYDYRLMKADPFLVRLDRGLIRPKNPKVGADFAGQVEAVGRLVKDFKPGDEVYGDLSAAGDGSMAEYATVPEKLVAHKPANLSFEEAAAVPMAALTALQGLRDRGRLQPGEKVLIQGASGGVGTFAVQIAKALGGEVTAVCSTGKMELARSLGADQVIDYTQEDFAERGEKYDLILAVNGFRPLSVYKNALKPNGRYVMAGGDNAQIFQTLLLSPFMTIGGNKEMGPLTCVPNQKDLDFMRELIEAGKVTPVVEKCYPLNEVPEAVGYLAQGHAKGKIAISMQ